MDEDALERAHYADVLAAFRGHAASVEPELRRREAAAAALPASLSALLPAGTLSAKLAAARAAVAVNQTVCDWIVASQEQDDQEGAPPTLGAQVGAPPSLLLAASPTQAARVKSVLSQMARELRTIE